MTLKAVPILPNFGAVMSGLDITGHLTPLEQQAVREAQHRHGVTHWRNTGLDDDSHIRFSRIFGYPEVRGELAKGPFRLQAPELVDVGNLDANGEIVTNELVRIQKHGDQLWHTDGSFIRKRSAYSLLAAYEVPPEGGETFFADTRTAYDDLPQAMKDRLDGLHALHSYWCSRRKAGFPISQEEVDEKPAARHPLVHVHAGSGRKALYVASHANYIEEMPRDEGRALLADLIAHATQPQYVFSVKWQPGDLVIWDNLCSMHRGSPFEDTKYRRDMRRTTIREGVAPERPDDPYMEMMRKEEFAFMQDKA